MLICHCRRVNDRTITELAARDCASLEEISVRCGAGTDCGGCRETIQRLLDGMAAPGRVPAEIAGARRAAGSGTKVSGRNGSWNERLAG